MPGARALVDAAKIGDVKAVKRLLDRGARADQYDYCLALERAAKSHHLEMAQLLLDRGARADKIDSKALERAARSNHLKMAKLLLDRGARADKNDSKALEWAAQRDHFEMAKLLLVCGARADKIDVSKVLERAAQSNDLEVAKLLLDWGARADEKGCQIHLGHDTTRVINTFRDCVDSMIELMGEGARCENLVIRGSGALQDFSRDGQNVHTSLTNKALCRNVQAAYKILEEFGIGFSLEESQTLLALELQLKNKNIPDSFWQQAQEANKRSCSGRGLAEVRRAAMLTDIAGWKKMLQKTISTAECHALVAEAQARLLEICDRAKLQEVYDCIIDGDHATYYVNKLRGLLFQALTKDVHSLYFDAVQALFGTKAHWPCSTSFQAGTDSTTEPMVPERGHPQFPDVGDPLKMKADNAANLDVVLQAGALQFLEDFLDDVQARTGPAGASGGQINITGELQNAIQACIDTLLRLPGTAGGRPDTAAGGGSGNKNIPDLGGGWEQSYPSSYKFGDRNISLAIDNNTQTDLNLQGQGETPKSDRGGMDERALYDLTVRLKSFTSATGEGAKVVTEACKTLLTRFADYPPQVFLHRPHVWDALGGILAGAMDCRSVLSIVFDCYLAFHRSLLLESHGDFFKGYEDLWVPDKCFPQMWLHRFPEGVVIENLPFQHFHRVVEPVLEACRKYAEAVPLTFRLLSWVLPMMMRSSKDPGGGVETAKLLQYSNLLSDALKSQFRGFGRDVTEMGQVRAWFGQPLTPEDFRTSNLRNDWGDDVRLKTFDWQPVHLILFDIVCLFLQETSSRSGERGVGGRGGEDYGYLGRLAEFLRVFHTDRDQGWERAERFPLLQKIVTRIWPEDGAEYESLAQLMASVLSCKGFRSRQLLKPPRGDCGRGGGRGGGVEGRDDVESETSHALDLVGNPYSPGVKANRQANNHRLNVYDVESQFRTHASSTCVTTVDLNKTGWSPGGKVNIGGIKMSNRNRLSADVLAEVGEEEEQLLLEGGYSAGNYLDSYATKLNFLGRRIYLSLLQSSAAGGKCWGKSREEEDVTAELLPLVQELKEMQELDYTDASRALWKSAVELCTQVALCPVRSITENFLNALETAASSPTPTTSLIPVLLSEQTFLVDSLLHLEGCSTEGSTTSTRPGHKNKHSEDIASFDRFLSLIQEHAGSMQRITTTAVGEKNFPFPLLDFADLFMAQKSCSSSFPAQLRKLFLKDEQLRKKQSLLLWQCQVLPSPEYTREADGIKSSLGFLPDPLDATVKQLLTCVSGFTVAPAETAHTLFCFSQYFLGPKLRVQESEFAHVCEVLENEKLNFNVRKAAAGQFVTFLVSDKRVVSMLREREETFGGRKSLKALSNALSNANEEFYDQACECLTVLLLAFSGGKNYTQNYNYGASASTTVSTRAKNDGSFVAEFLKGELLGEGKLMLLLTHVYHVKPLTRLRSLQLLTALLFSSDFVFPNSNSQTQHSPSSSTSTSCSGAVLKIPPWLQRRFEIPLQVEVLEPKPSLGAKFWQARPTARVLALCSVYQVQDTIVEKSLPQSPVWRKLKLDSGEGFATEQVYRDVESCLVPESAVMVLEDVTYGARLRSLLQQVPNLNALTAPSTIDRYLKALNHVKTLFEAAICGKTFVGCSFLDADAFLEVLAVYALPVCVEAVGEGGVLRVGVLDANSREQQDAAMAANLGACQAAATAFLCALLKTVAAIGHAKTVLNSTSSAAEMSSKGGAVSGKEFEPLLKTVLSTDVSKASGTSSREVFSNEMKRDALRVAGLFRLNTLGPQVFALLASSNFVLSTNSFVDSLDVVAALYLLSAKNAAAGKQFSAILRAANVGGGGTADPESPLPDVEPTQKRARIVSVLSQIATYLSHPRSLVQASCWRALEAVAVASSVADEQAAVSPGYNTTALSSRGEVEQKAAFLEDLCRKAVRAVFSLPKTKANQSPQTGESSNRAVSSNSEFVRRAALSFLNAAVTKLLPTAASGMKLENVFVSSDNSQNSNSMDRDRVLFDLLPQLLQSPDRGLRLQGLFFLRTVMDLRCVNTDFAIKGRIKKNFCLRSSRSGATRGYLVGRWFSQRGNSWAAVVQAFSSNAPGASTTTNMTANPLSDRVAYDDAVLASEASLLISSVCGFWDPAVFKYVCITTPFLVVMPIFSTSFENVRKPSYRKIMQ
eukprot:g5975.t1